MGPRFGRRDRVDHRERWSRRRQQEPGGHVPARRCRGSDRSVCCCGVGRHHRAHVARTRHDNGPRPGFLVGRTRRLHRHGAVPARPRRNNRVPLRRPHLHGHGVRRQQGDRRVDTLRIHPARNVRLRRDCCRRARRARSGGGRCASAAAWCSTCRCRVGLDGCPRCGHAVAARSRHRWRSHRHGEERTAVAAVQRSACCRRARHVGGQPVRPQVGQAEARFIVRTRVAGYRDDSPGNAGQSAAEREGHRPLRHLVRGGCHHLRGVRRGDGGRGRSAALGTETVGGRHRREDGAPRGRAHAHRHGARIAAELRGRVRRPAG